MKGPDKGQGCWETAGLRRAGRGARSGCWQKPGTVDTGLPRTTQAPWDSPGGSRPHPGLGNAGPSPSSNVCSQSGGSDKIPLTWGYIFTCCRVNDKIMSTLA